MNKDILPGWIQGLSQTDLQRLTVDTGDRLSAAEDRADLMAVSVLRHQMGLFFKAQEIFRINYNY